MVRLSIVLFLVQLVLAVVALISCLSAEEDGIRALPRLLWVLIILLFPLVGSIAWFVAGRPKAAAGGSGGWRVGRGFPEPPRPVAPDDNPEFLRSLDDGRTGRGRDRELFDQWEQDLKRREDDLRRRQEDPPPA
jgi:hypothetical protein